MKSAMIKRVLSGVTGFAMALGLWVLVLAVLLQGAGTDAGLMETMLLKHAPEASTGLPESEYPAMARMICRYLAGETDTFQYTMPDAYDRPTVLFQSHEQQHMADCRQLFLLDRQVMLGCMGLLGLCMIAALMLKRRQGTLRGFLAGCVACLALLTALAVWALVDFDGLFVLFHRLSFANNLWLLNPATDLLIRLMPLSFFVHYVTLIGITWLAALLLMTGGCALLLYRSRGKGTEACQ